MWNDILEHREQEEVFLNEMTARKAGVGGRNETHHRL
jgi:hypothetical protein